MPSGFFKSRGLSISPFLFHFYFHALLISFIFCRFVMPKLAQLILEMNSVENVRACHLPSLQNQDPHGGTSLYGSGWNLGL